MKKITIELLEKEGLCDSQCELFRQIFPNGMELTKYNVCKAVNAGFYVEWLDRLIPFEQYREYLSRIKPINYRRMYEVGMIIAELIGRDSTLSEVECAKDAEERLRKYRERVFKEATEVYEKLVSEQSAKEFTNDGM